MPTHDPEHIGDHEQPFLRPLGPGSGVNSLFADVSEAR